MGTSKPHTFTFDNVPENEHSLREGEFLIYECEFDHKSYKKMLETTRTFFTCLTLPWTFFFLPCSCYIQATRQIKQRKYRKLYLTNKAVYYEDKSVDLSLMPACFVQSAENPIKRVPYESIRTFETKIDRSVVCFYFIESYYENNKGLENLKMVSNEQTTRTVGQG